MHILDLDVELELEVVDPDLCLILKETHVAYPNIRSIIQVLPTMPVSTALAEKKLFSCMRCL